MMVECGLSLYAAVLARSPALLAFGSDSLVELLSAMVVLLQFFPQFSLSRKHANRSAGLLLFALAGIVTTTATVALALHLHPEVSRLGIAITIVALIVMPALAWLKNREAVRSNSPVLGPMRFNRRLVPT
jgi:divalent metal cation (Fe/Co/Zn/Cd) transporter